MKKKIIAAALVASAVMSASAMASDGTVTFNGSITDETCEVTSNSKALTVDMGVAGSNSFSGKGSTSLAKPFVIELTNCPAAWTATPKDVRVNFDGDIDNGDSSILKLDSASDAKNVGIQIRDASNNVVNMQEDSSTYTVTGGPTVNKLRFTARYIATAASVGAGTANAVTQFSINYK
ncbi:fimbrial protein [Pluralibacter gergoviae]|uniref:Fimbrial protein n=1 Tax=Pluralibacter gergoviae TaxID=61647 RepID=A0AAI9DM60_PLUGE|nr:fimbrial protein [Pluralibacter gergoviae]EKV0915984.1 fimbrial protein [Pluralibacter gergoviae]EKV9908060.1 fimbrial protein [Pluralibacter gergoviae]EKW7275649.1 fimbrial protein [Pluralibacter gergoviae]ELD4296805.1 fimbrial protein [Pluralibacter gergoviae]ELD4307454.1 fimbrial protein [Pluralibacter gergoviae]